MPGFRRVSEEELFRAWLFRVDRFHLLDPNDEPFDRFVIRHPGAVTIVPVHDDRTVTLVRQYRAAVGDNLLEVPAGKRDVDGEPPEETARRELEEEIGYRPGRLVKLAEFYNTPGFCDEYTHLYLALDLEDLGGNDAMGPEERAMTMQRVPLDRFDDLIASGELCDAKSIIGWLLARRFLDAGS